jgi:hypothetical protein
VSERAARLALTLIAAGLVGLACQSDLALLSGGRFWGDGATYHAMAWSLAEDQDIRYEARDLLRVRREFAAGPQGVFLKRSRGGLKLDPARGFPWVGAYEREIYFAKPFTYPLAAAPFVRAWGTRGLLVLNGLCLAFALAVGYAELRRRIAPLWALAGTVAIFLASAAPVYLVWPTPELFYLGLAAAAVGAWRWNRPVLAAALVGLATYSKPPHIFLAVPLLLEPFLGAGRRELPKRVVSSGVRGLVLLATTAGLFGVNALATGEWNYQGGAERKTFIDRFPLDRPEWTFGNSGVWMSTNQVGPSVQGKEAGATRGSEPAREAEEYRISFQRNLAYFWIGRFGGVVPYFFAAASFVLLFLISALRSPRVLVGALALSGAFTLHVCFMPGTWFGGVDLSRGVVLGLLPVMTLVSFPVALGVVGARCGRPEDSHAWLALTALLATALFYLWQIPDNWYGGSGTVGNRYFLSLLPLVPLLVPGRLVKICAAVGLLGGCAFVAPLLVSPLRHSLVPGHQTLHLPFCWLPAELTMLNDLSIFNEPWRKKRPVGDTEGDPGRRRLADPAAYYLYFPDDVAYGRETYAGGRTGFWLRGGASGEVFVRALEPVRSVSVALTGGPAGDLVSVGLGGSVESVSLEPSETRSVSLAAGSGFPYKGTLVYRLRFHSQRGRAPSQRAVNADPRVLGAFAHASLDVLPRVADR